MGAAKSSCCTLPHEVDVYVPWCVFGNAAWRFLRNMHHICDQVENIQLNLYLHVPFLSFFLHQMRTQQRRYGAEQIEWMLQMVMAKDDVCAHTKPPRGPRFVAMASHLPEVQKSQNNLYPQFPLYNEAVNAPTPACTMLKWMLKWTITRALTPNRWTQPCSRTFI